MKGFIVFPTYTTHEDKTTVELYGRLENGESFKTITTVEPYFFIKLSDLKKVKNLLKKYKTENINWKTFQGDNVIKISSEKFPDLQKLHKVISKKIKTYEYDIRPQYKFIIDKDLLGSIEIQGDFEKSEKVDRVYTNPEIKKGPENYNPELKVASIDIESDQNGKLYCIGICSENYKEVFMVTKHKVKNLVPCEDEKDCLEKFKAAIIKLDPDIITGWNVIDFDFKYLQDLYRKSKINFDIGRGPNNPRIRIESGFFKPSSMELQGRQVIDAMSFIKDPFIQEAPSIKYAKFESYKLEDVSMAFLNEGKHLKGKGRHKEIIDLYKKNTLESHKTLANYNLNDCNLVKKILEKTKMIPLAVERSQLTGLPIDRLTASIASFDSLYIRNAHARGLVSPTGRYNGNGERITGGYVFSSKSGIFHNVLIFDFKSLYPSVIRTFNIDPASFLEKKQPGSIESPNGAFFKNDHGILPDIIERLFQAREKAKKEKRELSSYAIKIIMNSFFGVLASANCRYFNLDMANAITHFGQFIIKKTAKEIENLGYKTIYSDTDSVFVESNLEKNKANSLGFEIEKEINEFYKKYVKENYNRESFLELEFEKQFISMLIPTTRGGETTKKRYAGLVEDHGSEKIQITGLEAIRGDWTEAAQEFQKELLRKVFKNEEVNKFIKNYVSKIKDGKLDDKLIYKKSIRKSLDKYTKTTPPHVKAARKLEKLDSNIISYYITTDGPEPTQKLKHKIDYKHYIEKQIKPIANQILVLSGKKFDDIIQGSTQSTLFSF